MDQLIIQPSVISVLKDPSPTYPSNWIYPRDPWIGSITISIVATALLLKEPVELVDQFLLLMVVACFFLFSIPNIFPLPICGHQQL